MLELGNVLESLLDVDGSCRDLNFESPTWEGVQTMFHYLSKNFTVSTVSSNDGTELKVSLPDAFHQLRNTGGTAVLDNGTVIVSHLQAYIFLEDDGSPFVELTFFPQDILSKDQLRERFIEWITLIQNCLQAKRAYARYENASWEFGDISSNSGVFLVLEPLS